MNRSFRTVWNRARGALVAVSEATSSVKQGSGATQGVLLIPGENIQQSALDVCSFFKATVLSAAVAGLFVGFTTAQAYTLPSDCTSAGGSMVNGVCTFTAPTKPGTPGTTDKNTTINATRYSFDSGLTVTSGDVTLQGGATEYTAPVFSLGGNKSGNPAVFQSTGTLSIIGGSAQTAVGAAYVSARDQNEQNTAVNGVLRNANTGNILIQGGSGKSAHGINAMARDDAAYIDNDGSGTITFKGGNGEGANGLNQMTTEIGSSAYIVNNSGGTINFEGSTGGSGVMFGAVNISGKTTATVYNAGTMNISGGAGGYGFGMLARMEAEGDFFNGGTITITPGGVTAFDRAGFGFLARGEKALGRFQNEGQVSIMGGGNPTTAAMFAFAAEGGRGLYSQGKGLVLPPGRGKTTANSLTPSMRAAGGDHTIIQGGSNTDSYGLFRAADGTGSTAEIEIGSGSFSILGGTGENAYGMRELAGNGATSKFFINDYHKFGQYSVLIKGGSGMEAHGILLLAGADSTGSIANTSSGDIIIEGGSGQNAYGLGAITNTGTASITNTGTGRIIFRGNDTSNTGFGLGYITAGGLGSISSSNGTLVFEGHAAAGLQTVSQLGGDGTISASGGTLELHGGTGTNGHGIRFNGYGGGEGSITLSGTASGVFASDARDVFGLQFNAVGAGSVGRIENTSSNALAINGGGIGYNAYWNKGTTEGASGMISSTSGMTITGGWESGIKMNVQGNPASSALNSPLTGLISVTGGNLTITGSSQADFYGIGTNASREGQGTIELKGSGVLTIQGGSAKNTYGLAQNAYSDSSAKTGFGKVTAEGAKVLIKGGTGANAAGIAFNANYGNPSTTQIFATDQKVSGILDFNADEVVIEAGSGTGAYGLGYNAQSFGAEGSLYVRKGNFTVTGNQAANAYGIYVNADGQGMSINQRSASGLIEFDSDAGKTASFGAWALYANGMKSGTGRIVNAGGGTFKMLGSSGTDSNGWSVWFNATGGGSGYITNSGAGILELGAYSLQANAAGNGSKGYIENTGAGDLIIRSGAVYVNATPNNETNATTIGRIENSGSGTLTIENKGVEFNANGEGSVGYIVNSGSGSLVLAQTETGAVVANGSADGEGHVVNTSEKTAMVLGGADSGYSIWKNADSGKGYIENSGLEMTLNRGSIKYAVNESGQGYIQNNGKGTLNINDGSVGIGVVLDGTLLIQNKSTGTLNVSKNAFENLFGYVPATLETSTIKFNNSGSGNFVLYGLTDNIKVDVSSDFGPATSSEPVVPAYDYCPSCQYVVLTNSGTGTFELKAGAVEAISDTQTNAIYYVALENASSGTFIIQGGSNAGAYAIGRLAEAPNEQGFRAHGNYGSGRLEVIGGIAAAINEVADVLTNDGSSKSSTLVVRGGSSGTGYGINKISGTLSNNGVGVLNIVAASASGINNLTGRISNAGTMNMSGTSDVYAVNDASKGTIANSGTATFNANSVDKLGILTNDTGGTVILSANSAATADAFGAAILDGYAINDASAGTITNNGRLYLTEKGINKVGTFNNAATGQVYATAKTFFESGTTQTSTQDIAITVMNPEHPYDQNRQETTLSGYQATITTSGTWGLLSKWTGTGVKWTDGGSLTISDIKAGSAAAEQMKTAFQNKWGTGTTLNFTGSEGGSDASTSVTNKPDFTLTHVNTMLTEKKLSDGLVVATEYLSMGGTALTVGAESDANSNLKINTGFKGVKGASGVTIKDGKKLYIFGEASTTAQTADPSRGRAVSTAVDSVVDLKGSTLVLGATNYRSTEGIVKGVTSDRTSLTDVQNGFYTIETLNTEGLINVAAKANLVTTQEGVIRHLANDGRFTAEKKLTVKDDNRTFGEASGVTNAKDAVMTLGDVDVVDGGSITNMGTLTAGDVFVGAGGSLTNAEGATLTTKNLTLRGAFRNAGADSTVTVTDTLTANAAVLAAGLWKVNTFRLEGDASDYLPPTEIAAEAFVDTLELDGGRVVVKKGGTLAGTSVKNGEVKSRITVEKGGVFGFAHDKTSLSEARAFYKGGDVEDRAVVSLTRDLTFAEGGRLTVGTPQKETGTVNLGADALLLLSTSSLHGEPLLSGKADQALHAEKGAVIQLTDVTVMGRHYLMSGFDRTSSDEIVNVGVLDRDGKPLAIKANDKGVYISVGADTSLDLGPTYGLSGSLDAVLDGLQNVSSSLGDVGFLSATISTTTPSGGEATRKMERLAAEAGVYSETERLGVAANSLMMNHALERSSRSATGSAFWADGLYSKMDLGTISTSSGTSYGYDVDVTGFAFGLDAAQGDWRFGAAFSAQKGDLDGATSDLSSDIDAYGFSLYGARSFGNGFALTGGLTYLTAQHDFTQNALGAVKGDADAQAFVLGVRGEKTFEGSGFTATPYLGVEVVRTIADGFTSTWSGKAAFDYGKVTGTLWRVPVGVRAEGFVPVPSLGENSKLKFTADASVTPQMGDRGRDYAVRAVSLGTTDRFSADSADKVLGELKLGLGCASEKGAFSVNYAVQKGDVRDWSHSINAKAEVYF